MRRDLRRALQEQCVQGHPRLGDPRARHLGLPQHRIPFHCRWKRSHRSPQRRALGARFRRCHQYFPYLPRRCDRDDTAIVLVRAESPSTTASRCEQRGLSSRDADGEEHQRSRRWDRCLSTSRNHRAHQPVRTGQLAQQQTVERLALQRDLPGDPARSRRQHSSRQPRARAAGHPQTRGTQPGNH